MADWRLAVDPKDFFDPRAEADYLYDQPDPRDYMDDDLPFPYNTFDQDMVIVWAMQLTFLLSLGSGCRWHIRFLPDDVVLFMRDFKFRGDVVLPDVFTTYYYIHLRELMGS